MSDQPAKCELCERALALTRHHLIPRTRHKNKKNKNTFDRADVKGRIAWVCRACHDNIHAVLTEKELERRYNTLEELAAHPKIQKFTNWIRTKPETEGVRVKDSRQLSAR